MKSNQETMILASKAMTQGPPCLDDVLYNRMGGLYRDYDRLALVFRRVEELPGELTQWRAIRAAGGRVCADIRGDLP